MSHMSRLYAPSIIAAIHIFTSSCVSGPQKASTDPIKNAKTQGAATTRPAAAKAPAKGTPRKVRQELSQEAEYSAFFSRMAVPENDYTEKDRQTFLGFPGAPSGGTIHEAALTVGIIRDVLTPIGSSSKPFKEVDTTPSASVNTTSPTAVVANNERQIDHTRVIETRGREKGIDILSALASNPYLKNHGIFNMAWDASRIEGNSQTFVQNLSIILKSEVMLWGDLARRLGIEAQPVSAITPATTPTTPSTTPSAEPAVTPAPATESLSTVDNAEAVKMLSKAQDFAQKEDFEKATTEARKIPQGAENFAMAQEMLKTWANKAVQDLRRQAANQYRLSSSTSDATSKKAYLSKARAALQDALTKYPEASTLDTVKENMDIIQKEEDRLK